MNVSTFIELFKAWTLLGKLFPRRKPFPVLIVDDCRDDCEIIASIVSEIGLPCETVSSPEGAQVAIRHSQYSLVLLDIKFPPDDAAGIGFFRQIKIQRPALKVVFLSGYPRSLEDLTVGHTVMSISKNMERESLKSAILEAIALNGGFHASPQDIWFAAFLLFAFAGFLGHNDTQIINWIKYLWKTFNTF